MLIMKKLITLIIAFGLISINSFAQDYNKFQMKRATLFSNYITEQMGLNETEKKFVYDVMLARIYNANTKIQSENLTASEDKRAVYSTEYKTAQEKLADKFGAKMARKMMTLSNEARKKAEKK